MSRGLKNLKLTLQTMSFVIHLMNFYFDNDDVKASVLLCCFDSFVRLV